MESNNSKVEDPTKSYQKGPRIQCIVLFLALINAQGFKLGSASGHVRRTLVPSHEGHINIPLGGTLTECRLLT